jgi:hypothetical protein
MERKQNSASPGAGAELAALLDFTLVAVRARHDGWTPERQLRYVAVLAVTGHGGVAAAHVGMSEQSACRLRRRPDGASFARACGMAWRLAARRRRALAAARRHGPDFSCPREAET